MSTNIYILKLKDNNYYVGKAKDVNKRFQEHVSGNGSSWTKKHKPIEIIKVINNCSSFEEDKQVKELMSLHGIDKVRGGIYTKIDLTKEEKDILQKEIWGAKDVCTRCGNSNHFIKDCYAKTDINKNKIEEEIIIWECEYCDKQFEDIKDCEKHEKSCKSKPKLNKKQKCKRCGRQNHNESNCYASVHVDGYELDDESSDLEEYNVWACEYCDKQFEDIKDCEKHEKLCKPKKNKTCCKRCGRKNHNENNCYASVHADGYDLDEDSNDFSDSSDSSDSSDFNDFNEVNKVNKFNNIQDASCFRCGRKGHFANECYATKHVKGYYMK